MVCVVWGFSAFKCYFCQRREPRATVVFLTTGESWHKESVLCVWSLGRHLMAPLYTCQASSPAEELHTSQGSSSRTLRATRLPTWQLGT